MSKKVRNRTLVTGISWVTQEMPVSKKVRIRTFSVRIRTCFRVRFLKNSRANQMRASDGLAYWTVIGHPKVHTKIGFASNSQVSGPV